MTYVLKKYQKRLYVSKDGERVYTPPDFLLHRINRNNMSELVANLNAGRDKGYNSFRDKISAR